MGDVRALVLEAPRRLVERAFDPPRISERDALLRVEACGLCGTDHEQYSGALPGGLPFVPGHETVGVIEEIGALAQERFGVAAGDRVAVEVFQSCRKCAPCASGEHQRCESHGISDMYGFVPVSRPPSLWGGYAQFQYLSFDTVLHRVPAGLDPVLAAMFNPLGAGIRWGARLPGTSEGDVVAVLGPGIRGLSACAAAKQHGAAFVLVTGKGAPDTTRLSVARGFGADLTVDVDVEDPTRALLRETGTLADIVVDVTAKAPDSLAQAVSLARPGGTVVLAGTRGTTSLRGFDPDLVVFKELNVVGALGVDSDSYSTALELLDSGAFPFSELPRKLCGLDDAAGLLETMGGHGMTDTTRPVHAVIVPG